VLELGAGTGKLTGLLRPRFARVVAVEPDDGMLLAGVGELLQAREYHRRWETRVHWARKEEDRPEMPHARRPV
jgi:hypothetical protein